MLSIQQLNKTFYPNTLNEKQLFTSFNLTVSDGEFVSIIGSNGAGKSTLLDLISGSICADSGTILLNDVNLIPLKEYERTQFMSRVFQNPAMGTSPSMTIAQNLALAKNRGKKYGLSLLESKKNMDLFKSLVAPLELGLENQLTSPVGLLSGGQRQALALLMATLVKPDLLLLDEHTAALDPNTSAKMMELTSDIVTDSHITTLMVTHNLNHAITYGNRLIMLHEGQIVLDVSNEKKKQLTPETLLHQFEKNIGRTVIGELLFS